MKTPPNKPLDPRLRPLLELLARRAYDDIKAGKFEKPRSVPDQPAAPPTFPKQRTAS